MAQRFREQALVDLESARENVRPRRYHNAIFFAEQAAEKALKAAYWHLLAEEPAWKHNLDEIATSVGNAGGGIPREVQIAVDSVLSIFEGTRYPSADVEEPIPG